MYLPKSENKNANVMAAPEVKEMGLFIDIVSTHNLEICKIMVHMLIYTWFEIIALRHFIKYL